MNILITAFEPFNGAKMNPSEYVARQLPSHINGHKVDTLILPTAFRLCVDNVKQRLRMKGYDVVIGLGQAGGRTVITPERVAINIDDARIPDNKGYQPIDCPIQQQGPSAYFSTLPVKRMVQVMLEVRVPSALSNSAGTFVCNHLMYELAHIAHTQYPQLRTGFIHLPYEETQAKTAGHASSMTLNTMVKGIEAAIRVVTEEDTDIDAAYGTLS